MADDYLKPADAADFLGLTKDHLAQLRYRGEGPIYLRITPRVIKYRRADLTAWADGSAVVPRRPGTAA